MADETAADISVMVTLVAEAIGTRNEMSAEEAWQLAGRILCPIFDYAKPASYIQAMTETRRDFAGIAVDDDIRVDFRMGVQALLTAGSLDSLERAVADEAWRELQSRRPAYR